MNFLKGFQDVDKQKHPENRDLPNEIGESESEDLPDEIGESENDELSREVGESETDNLPEEIGELENEDLPDEVGDLEDDDLPDEVDEEYDETEYPEDSMIAVFKRRDANDNTGDANKDVNEEAQVVKNKRDGCERENQVEEELKEEYPESEGYQIVKEAYLRDEDGNFVVDPVTGTRRRIDFVVVKDGKVVKSVEVTSMTAPKDEQMAKEQRIREQGGNYIDNNGELVEFPDDVQTEIERRT